MKRVVSLLVMVLLFMVCSNVFCEDVEISWPGPQFYIVETNGDRSTIEWHTSVRNSTGDIETVMVKCIFLDSMDHIIVEDTVFVKVGPYGNRPVKGVLKIRTYDANRIMACMGEVW